MRPTDVRVADVTVRFRDVPFAAPLVLSSGPIDGLTEATVTVEVDAAGRHASGTGSVLLSHPWAYGSTGHDDAGDGSTGGSRGNRDTVMRSAVAALAQAVLGSAGDPLSIGAALLDALPDLPLPRLAAEVCLGPVDAAVHDAWARAAGRSAFQLYADPYVPDLSAFLGPDFAGRYPVDYLAPRPPARLPVQWVVGANDPLDGLAGARWLKVKLAGADPAHDAARVMAVQAAAGPGCRLALDPNEGYRTVSDVTALLDALPPGLTVDYVEQPLPRSAAVAPPGNGIPVLLDEGLPDPRRLNEVTGWDGVVVKTCRGQTAALLTYCWARQRGRYVVQQDLTHVGAALEHAAAFATRTVRAVPAFECNSLQYAPAGNDELARRRPELVTVVDGTIDVSGCGREGIR
ncbi:L-alanine-DL-glutamate epimerase [Micromonospora rhizosphaerae]|uniref:L-alanine-DL-glutamate epimerase n=1 Tax=Micromonospora rhizosphaerae TaxID=568872 RepID=A0A1C6SAY3_9ACTN|nr:enolase C-terminal domain-like protein [Micromonospora rhizosphaerae]SCL26598.1 L-alanine-DL-glutamate epimerase [Micromonospora rhizosphaerae]